MAYSYAALSAGKISAYNADKPLFVGSNLLASGSPTITWSTLTTPVGASPDETSASYPTSRIRDFNGLLPSKASTTSQVKYSLVITGIALGEFDSIIIHGQGIGQDSQGVSVAVEIANDSAFSSGLKTIATTSILAGTNKRSALLNLQFDSTQNLIYSDVQYMRVGFTIGSGSFSTPPSVTELFIGERSQLSRASNLPWDDRGFVSEVSDAKSEGGAIYRVVKNYGGKQFNFSATPTGVDTYSLDDVTTLDNLAEQTNFFTKPFYFIPKPYSEPYKAYLVYKSDPTFSLTLSDWEERSFEATLIEQPTFVAIGD